MFQPFSIFGQFQGIEGMLQGQMFGQQQGFFEPFTSRACCSPSSAIVTPVVTPVVVIVNGTFVFEQAVAAAVWVIDYPFIGQFPSVTITDIAGNVVIADVQYIEGLDRVILTFAQPFAGTAYLNV